MDVSYNCGWIICRGNISKSGEIKWLDYVGNVKVKVLSKRKMEKKLFAKRVVEAGYMERINLEEESPVMEKM